MKYNPLGKTGLNVSRLSFGASSLGGVFRPVDEAEGDPRRARRARSGHQLLRRRAGLRRHAWRRPCSARRSRASRATATYLSTKVGKYTSPGAYGDDTLDYSRARIRASLDESAQRLGTDYFDIIHIHDIEYQGRRHTEWALGRRLRCRAAN